MIHHSGFEQLVEHVRARIRECSVQEVHARVERHEPFHLLDVREDHEYVTGYAQGAVHLGRGILERDIEKLIPDKDAEIVLYCGGGYRSVLAAVSLMEMGYTRVASMAGGIKAWRQAGLPIDPGPDSQ